MEMETIGGSKFLDSSLGGGLGTGYPIISFPLFSCFCYLIFSSLLLHACQYKLSNFTQLHPPDS